MIKHYGISRNRANQSHIVLTVWIEALKLWKILSLECDESFDPFGNLVLVKFLNLAQLFHLLVYPASHCFLRSFEDVWVWLRKLEELHLFFRKFFRHHEMDEIMWTLAKRDRILFFLVKNRSFFVLVAAWKFYGVIYFYFLNSIFELFLKLFDKRLLRDKWG